jgi:threonine/homoserine/homoserine lactone efflux protein
MTLASLLAFCAVYIAAVASPGPGVAAVVARVLGFGYTKLWAFIAGFVVGDLVWFCVAAAGLAVIAEHFASVFLVVKYAGAAYLLFIAYKIWTAPVAARRLDAEIKDESAAKLFLASLALTLGNPKVIAFFLALLPTVIDLASLTSGSFALLAALCALILPAVLLVYALAAGQARALFTSVKAQRAFNRGTGAMMAGVAVAVAAR